MKSVLISTRPKWCDIIGYENEYQINQFGEIRTLKNSSKRKKYDILKPQINSKNGYVYQMLYKNGKGKLWRVHRLVAMIFLPNPYNLPQVNHIDGDKSNNHISNLEWCSQKENELHSRKVINTKEYKPFRVIYNNGQEVLYDVKSDLSEKLGVTTACVKNWLHNKSKGYVNYDIEIIEYV